MSRHDRTCIDTKNSVYTANDVSRHDGSILQPYVHAEVRKRRGADNEKQFTQNRPSGLAARKTIHPKRSLAARRGSPIEAAWQEGGEDEDQGDEEEDGEENMFWGWVLSTRHGEIVLALLGPPQRKMASKRPVDDRTLETQNDEFVKVR